MSSNVKVLRTPDERFANLPGYNFAPHYIEVPAGFSMSAPATLRMHYVEEGPADGAVILLLHGEPSWSYLYRKMIPPLAAAGFRVVAPDLIGFGKSDKPADRAVFTYQSHMDWLSAFVAALDLRGITLFCQDWGGLLGLRLAAEQPDRFARIVAGNTFLPTGEGQPSPEFLRWREFSQAARVFRIGRVVSGGCHTRPAREIERAYDAPYPDLPDDRELEEGYKAAARAFPALVPVTTDDPASAPNRAAWEVLRTWQKPFLTLFSDGDPITKGGQLFFRRAVPGAKGQAHTIIKNAGHFLQEDRGEEIAEHMIAFIRNTPQR